VSDKKQCLHMNFNAKVDVNRLHNGNEKISDYLADVRIWCADCELPFQFRGIPHGLNGNQPTTGLDQLEASLPVIPADGCLRPLSKMPGFSVAHYVKEN